MSRSNRDQRGKRTSNEIWGHNEFFVAEDGKAYPVVGGSEVGSADGKRGAKKAVAHLRRMRDKRDIVLAMHEL